jgi:hypothetical protein
MVVQVERSAHFEGPCRVSGALEGLGYQHNSAVIHCVRANNLSFCCVVLGLVLLTAAARENVRFAYFLLDMAFMYIAK